MVHRANRQQRGDVHLAHRVVVQSALVAQHHQLAARSHRRLGLCAHIVQRLLHRALTCVLEEDGDSNGAQLLVRLDLLELGLVDDRRVDVHLRAELFRGFQQIATRAQAHVEAHDQPLAQRVNGRVGHLREALLEVVVEQVRFAGEHCQWDVVAHREGRLLAVGGHLVEHHLHVLGAVAEHGLLLEHLGLLGHLPRPRGVRVAAAALQPFGVGRLGAHILLDGGVLARHASLQVDGEHLTRAQAALAHRVGGVLLHHAHLRGDVHHVVRRLPETRGAQAVAVKCGAHRLAVGEHHECGAVPRLLRARVELVELLGLGELLQQLGMVAVRLGHADHHGLLGVATRAHEHLCDAVQVGAVRVARVAHTAEDMLAALPQRVL
mmetsp:Transcript_12361/g.38139  ORF Transcript_12361/g.38139 Transcript_12361/m.38139 type:complete len:379 (+) Transcript_12361:400-1536(+)